MNAERFSMNTYHCICRCCPWHHIWFCFVHKYRCKRDSPHLLSGGGRHHWRVRSRDRVIVRRSLQRLQVPVYARLHIPYNHARCKCSSFHLPPCLKDLSSDLGKVKGCTLHDHAVCLDLETRAQTRPRQFHAQSREAANSRL